MEDFAALRSAKCFHRRSLDSAVLVGSATTSRDDGAEADSDGRGKCAGSKSVGASGAWRTRVNLKSANQIGRPDSAKVGTAQSKPLEKPGACDVAAAVGQSRTSGPDVEPIAPKVNDRARLQAERCDELSIARLPEAVMDPEEESSGADHPQGHGSHRGGAYGTEAMYFVRAR